MFAFLALLQLIIPTSLSTCVSDSTSALQWTSSNNKLYLNGAEFKQKGLSWFGFDSDTNIVHGLWSNSYTNILDWIASQGFNAIRVPFSYNAIMSGYVKSTAIGSSGNSVFNGKSSIEAMDILIDAAADRGLLIMLDYHCTNENSYLEGLGDQDLNAAKTMWQTLARRYKDKWNIFMADIYNEPHDVMNYNGGGQYQWNDWIQWVEETSELILAEGVNWLIGVQGTNHDCSLRSGSADNNCFWGENLQGVDPLDSSQGRTVQLSIANRFVWLPHVYGPDLNSYVSDRQYSAAIWSDHWGYLCDGSYPANGAACMVGEFGTKYDTTAGQNWLNALVDYLISIDSRNSWFWCLNNESGDTEGLLLGDWKTTGSRENAKLEVLARLQPNPSTISVSNGQVCVDGTGGSDTDTNTGTGTDTGTGTGTDSGTDSGSSGTITITQKDGANQWWYAVTLSTSSGLTVTSLKMKGSGMWSWEEGVQEWDYWKFTGNPPYSAPLSFQATLSTGQVVEGQVIDSISSGASGTLSVSSAYTADEDAATTDGLSSGGMAAIVLSAVLVCCMMGALCFVCYRKRNKVIAAGVEDEEVIGDTAIVEEMEKESGYDMTTIDNGDGPAAGTGDNEQEVMIEVPVTETNQ